MFNLKELVFLLNALLTWIIARYVITTSSSLSAHSLALREDTGHLLFAFNYFNCIGLGVKNDNGYAL